MVSLILILLEEKEKKEALKEILWPLSPLVPCPLISRNFSIVLANTVINLA